MSEESQEHDKEIRDEIEDRCICHEGFHDRERIDCACKCHKEEEEKWKLI